jgi:outer membrane protein assembly factor BamB
MPTKRTPSRALAFALLPVLLAGCSMPSWFSKKEKPKLEGSRVTALSETSALSPSADLASKPPVLPAPAANADWPQHSGVFTATTGNLAAGEWKNRNSTSAGEGNDFVHGMLPRPVVAQGAVFVMDGKGYVSAHDATNIDKQLWLSKAVASKKEALLGGGLSFDAGVLYVTSGRGAVAALDAANGTERWQRDLGIPLRAPARISGDVVVVTTIDSQTYGLSAKNGEILWDHRGINETAGVMTTVTPVVAGDAVIVPYASGELFSLAMADGKERWAESLIAASPTRATAEFSGIGGDPVVDSEVVFATSHSGVTAALHIPTGNRVWQQSAASYNTPWLAGEELFMLTSDNTVVDMLKFTGKIRWSTKLDSYQDAKNRLDPITWRGPVLAGGRLVVIGSHGKLVSLSPSNGAINEERDIPDDIFTAPVVAGGRLYLLAKDATLYSFE